MRIVAPLFPEERTERLDRTRVTLGVSLWFRHVAQGGSPSGHPIVDENMQRGVPPYVTGITLLVRRVEDQAAQCGVPSPSCSVCKPLRRLLAAHVAHCGPKV